MKKIEQETEQQPAYVVHYHTLHYENSTLDLEGITTSVSPDGDFKKVLLIENRRIWFVYVEYHSNCQVWNLASVGEDGSDYQLHYSGEFVVDAEADRHFRINNQCRFDYFKEENGFYYNGRIVLSDHVKIVEYVLQSGIATEYKAADYHFPTGEIDVAIDQYQIIRLYSQAEEQMITVENAANSSMAMKSLLEMNAYKTWDQTPILSYMFDSVQSDGKDLYIVCRVLNFLGETYAVVFQYDYPTGNVQYSFNLLMGDLIDNELYIVPTI